MTKYAVFDANCIHLFQNERIQDAVGKASAAIQHVFANGKIVLDEEGRCLNEWVSCANGADRVSLGDWVSDNLAAGTIELRNVPPMADLRKKLLKLGLPADDHKWFALGSVANAALIASDDIDLYHPPAKAWKAKKKQSIKDTKQGYVCKFAKKELAILVVQLHEVTTCF